MIRFSETVLDRKDDLSVYCLSVHGESFLLAPGLTLGEFASNCGQDQVIVSQRFLQMYTVLRAEAGPITINRGYSSWLHHVAIYEDINAERRLLGKEELPVPERSYHLFGMAADMVPHDMSTEDFAELCVAIGFGGVKNYGSFVHADNGRKRTW